MCFEYGRSRPRPTIRIQTPPSWGYSSGLAVLASVRFDYQTNESLDIVVSAIAMPWQDTQKFERTIPSARSHTPMRYDLSDHSDFRYSTRSFFSLSVRPRPKQTLWACLLCAFPRVISFPILLANI